MGKIPYLIEVDTGGISVESSIAGRLLTAETAAEAIKESGVEQKAKHRYLIIPDLAARLSGEIEDLTGWNVLVGAKGWFQLRRFHWEIILGILFIFYVVILLWTYTAFP